MSKASSRAKRNQQILFGLLSLIVVLSMGLALISTPSVTQVVPTATLNPAWLTPPTPLPLATSTLTPTLTSTPAPTP